LISDLFVQSLGAGRFLQWTPDRFQTSDLAKINPLVDPEGILASLGASGLHHTTDNQVGYASPDISISIQGGLLSAISWKHDYPSLGCQLLQRMGRSINYRLCSARWHSSTTASRRYVQRSVVCSLLLDHIQTAAIGRVQLSLRIGRGLKRRVEFY
jgi:hypothetical protein